MSRRQRSPGGAAKRLGSLLAIGLLSLGIVSCGDGSTSGQSRSTPQSRQATIRAFGSEVGGSEAKQAESAVLGYLDARAGGEWAKACSYLTHSIRSVFERIAAKTERSQGDCAGLIEMSTKRLSPAQRAGLGKAEVKSVRLREGRGYVLFGEPDGGEEAVPVKSEQSEWRVAGGITQLVS